MPPISKQDKAAWLAQAREAAIATDWGKALAPAEEIESSDYYDPELFLKDVETFGKNEDGDPIRLFPWYRQVIRFVGDSRIPGKAISGCQQLGKTVSISSFLAYSVVRHGHKAMYSYDSMGARDLQTKQNIRPVLEAWEAALYPNHVAIKYTRNSEVWESSSGGLAQFPYSSVNANVKSRQGLASAGGRNVGVKMDLLFDEERSQSAPGARDPFMRRLAESRLNPNPPHVNNGTPGAGLGIELDFQRLDHHFAPYYDCPECGCCKPLHPKGCLLRPVERTEGGETVTLWYTESGKPLKWWHSDPNRPEATAYVGCSECGAELPEEVRLSATYRECRFSISLEVDRDLGRTLEEFQASLPPGAPLEHKSAGLWISPLCRGGNPAPSIIRGGNTSANTSDWQQQALGLTSEASANAITIEMIKAAIGAVPPQRNPDVILAGLDQGRQQDWLWISRVWLPDGWQRLTHPEIAAQAVRQVVFGDAIERGDIDALLSKYGVEFGLMDSEPDIPDAVTIAKRTVFELSDQSPMAKVDVERIDREAGGAKYKVYKIRQKDFQDRVLQGFQCRAVDGLPLYRLPESWKRWETLIGAELSPITHLTSMRRDPEVRRWIRPDDHNDDHFFAAMFLEAALEVWLKSRKGSVMNYSRVTY